MKESQAPISSRTGLLGVIGDPIEHSLSPLLHNHVLARLGLDWRYLAFRVSAVEVPNVGRAMRALGIRGLNVTIPHKEAVLPQMDSLTDEARKIGAVNTIGLAGDGSLVGHNTDAAGFVGALEAEGLQGEPKGFPSVVIGAGGAARAIMYALIGLGSGPIRVVNRTQRRAEDLAFWAANFAPQVKVETIPLQDVGKLEEALQSAMVTVNVTPLGLAPSVDSSPLPTGVLPRPGTILFDTIYNPTETLLISRAGRHGCRIVGGLDMLIIQGLESLAWWLERPVPWRGMLPELRSLLKERLQAKR